MLQVGIHQKCSTFRKAFWPHQLSRSALPIPVGYQIQLFYLFELLRQFIIVDAKAAEQELVLKASISALQRWEQKHVYARAGHCRPLM